MTHKNERVLSVAELARVEGEGAPYIRAIGDQGKEARLEPTCATSCRPTSTWTTPNSPPRCEQAIRNYDPCISCSTHFLDLTVERS